MNDRQASFREDVRFKILRMLETHPEYSQRDLADALGISLGGVNYCLQALIDKGFVKVANFRRSDNKRGYAYLLTASGISERALLTSRFLQRKIREYDIVKAEIEDLMRECGGGNEPLAQPPGERTR